MYYWLKEYVFTVKKLLHIKIAGIKGHAIDQ